MLEIKSFSHKIIKFHVKLQKTESFIIIQIHTNHNKLIIFLNKKCVQNFFFSICLCNQVRETAKHVIVHCSRFTKYQTILQDLCIRQININKLVDDSERAM